MCVVMLIPGKVRVKEFLVGLERVLQGFYKTHEKCLKSTCNVVKSTRYENSMHFCPLDVEYESFTPGKVRLNEVQLTLQV